MSRARALVWSLAAILVIAVSRQIAYALAGDAVARRLAGQGGGAFETGRVVNANGRSNNDLLVSVQRAAGVDSDTFGLASLCKGPIV